MGELDKLRFGLTRRKHVEEPKNPETRLAAVAAVVRERDVEGGAEVLLIRRAEDPNDPWSGHMAFPGGRKESGDLDLVSTAIRETREEVGLDLGAGAELLGPLDELGATARGRRVELVVAPFVFAVVGDPVLTLNREVSETHWAPIAPLLRGDANAEYRYLHEGVHYPMPGYRVGERVVWGMTYRMLQLLFETLRER